MDKTLSHTSRSTSTLINAGLPSVIPVLRSQTKSWGKAVSRSTLTRDLWVQGEILPQYSGDEWGNSSLASTSGFPPCAHMWTSLLHWRTCSLWSCLPLCKPRAALAVAEMSWASGSGDHRSGVSRDLNQLFKRQLLCLGRGKKPS